MRRALRSKAKVVCTIHRLSAILVLEGYSNLTRALMRNKVSGMKHH